MQDKGRKVIKKDKGIYVLIVVALLMLIIDQFTKTIIRRNLVNGESVSIINGFVQLKGIENPGGAFGFFPGNQVFLLSISVIVVSTVLIYWQISRPSRQVINISFGLIVGGALGNMIDRLMFKNVTDFIDFRFWPVFNIADLAIVFGMIFFLNSYLKDEKNNRDT